MKYTLYIGLNDKDTGKQYNLDLAKHLVNQVVSREFEGFTMFEGTGYYKGQKEKCLIVQLFYPYQVENSINEIIKMLCFLLNQECIGLVKEDVNIIYKDGNN